MSAIDDQGDSVAITRHVREVDGGVELGILEQRFGIPRSTFDPYLLFRPNRKALWICRRDLLAPEHPEPLAVGFPFFYVNMQFPRPTTSAVLRFGHLARRHRVALEDAWVAPFLQRQPIPIPAATAAPWSGHGYLIAHHRGTLVGLGIWRPEETAPEPGGAAPASAPDARAGTLQGMCPRSWIARMGLVPPTADG